MRIRIRDPLIFLTLDPRWNKFVSGMEKIRIRDSRLTTRIRNTGRESVSLLKRQLHWLTRGISLPPRVFFWGIFCFISAGSIVTFGMKQSWRTWKFMNIVMLRWAVIYIFMLHIAYIDIPVLLKWFFSWMQACAKFFESTTHVSENSPFWWSVNTFRSYVYTITLVGSLCVLNVHELLNYMYKHKTRYKDGD